MNKQKEAKVQSPYSVLCVWPGLVLGDTPHEEIAEWFKGQFDIRINGIEEIQTLRVLDDGAYRNDVVFRVHEEDIAGFATKRLATPIKWWGDWITGLDHTDDYSISQLERFKGYEFN